MNWFAVATRPMQEYLAETELRRVGIESYLPQYRRELVVGGRNGRDKRRVVKKFPLFSGYLFTPADGLDWSAMFACDGISRDGPLRDGLGKPVPIPGSTVDGIRQREEAGLFDDLHGADPRLEGSRIVVTGGGPMDGLEGLVRAVRGRNARVVLSLLGREIDAKVPLEKVRKIA